MAIDLSQVKGLDRETGYPGQVNYIGAVDIVSFVNGGTTGLDNGVAVVRGDNAGSCKRPSADNQKIIGLTVRHMTKLTGADGNTYYDIGESLPVLRDGYIHATAGENVTAGAQVVSITAQGTLGGGSTGSGRVAVGSSTWETTTPAGATGLIRVKC